MGDFDVVLVNGVGAIAADNRPHNSDFFGDWDDRAEGSAAGEGNDDSSAKGFLEGVSVFLAHLSFGIEEGAIHVECNHLDSAHK